MQAWHADMTLGAHMRRQLCDCLTATYSLHHNNKRRGLQWSQLQTDRGPHGPRPLYGADASHQPPSAREGFRVDASRSALRRQFGNNPLAVRRSRGCDYRNTPEPTA